MASRPARPRSGSARSAGGRGARAAARARRRAARAAPRARGRAPGAGRAGGVVVGADGTAGGGGGGGGGGAAGGPAVDLELQLPDRQRGLLDEVRARAAGQLEHVHAWKYERPPRAGRRLVRAKRLVG